MGQMTSKGGTDSRAQTRVPSQRCRAPGGQVVHGGQSTWPWLKFFGGVYPQTQKLKREQAVAEDAATETWG